MCLLLEGRIFTNPALVRPDEESLRRRVLAEFKEMPGLILTLPQAARLFGLALPECQRILVSLVDTHDLATDGARFALEPLRKAF
jgi:hypothetical protein